MSLRADDINELYDRHAGELLGFFMNRTCSPDVSVDLVSETFAAAFESRLWYRGVGPVKARGWLYAIARSLLVDYYGAGEVERRALDRLAVKRRGLTDEEHDRIEELAGSSAMRERVAAEVLELPQDQRDAVLLRVVEERSYEAVARRLGVSEQTARAQIGRAHV